MSQNSLQATSFSSDEELQDDRTPRSSLWKTVFNMLNYMEGVGFLALPYAVHRGGIAAVIAFFVFPFIMGYTCHLLVECLYDEDEDGDKIRVRSTYQEIGRDCWPAFETIVRLVISISHFPHDQCRMSWYAVP